MGQLSLTDIFPPAADRKPAVSTGLRISQFDNATLSDSASVALTWICLAGPASAPKA